MWPEFKRHVMTENAGRSAPKEMAPVPVLSNSWKATMKRASGAHSTDSKARNSWNEISLPFGGVHVEEEEKKTKILMIQTLA